MFGLHIESPSLDSDSSFAAAPEGNITSTFISAMF
jgi:hypothetical protein